MTKPVAAHGNAQLVCAVQHGMKTSPSAAATRYVKRAKRKTKTRVYS